MASIGAIVGDPITFVMERRMLLGIEQRAEKHVASDESARIATTLDTLVNG